MATKKIALTVPVEKAIQAERKRMEEDVNTLLVRNVDGLIRDYKIEPTARSPFLNDMQSIIARARVLGALDQVVAEMEAGS